MLTKSGTSGRQTLLPTLENLIYLLSYFDFP